MKKNLIKLSSIGLFLFGMFASEVSTAQLTGVGTMIDLSDNMGRMHIRTGEQVREASVMKPYLSEDYFNGVITLTNGTTVPGAFRYNVMDEELEMMGSDQKYLWKVVEKFEWDNKITGNRETWQNIKRIWPAFEYGGFGLKLSDQVVAKYFMDYIAPTRDPKMDVGDPNSYYIAELYHYAILDNKLMEIPKSKNDFFKMFGDWEKVMKKHASKEKLKHNNSSDIAELMAVYYRTKK